MSQKLATAVSATCAALLHGGLALAASLPAFPGAEGFGANSTGGRGGDVYHVTTLADDPTRSIPGSLYYGLYEKHVPAEGRTIVFDVGGTIKLGATALDIKNINKVTIAGHTAPSPITIVGNTLQITGSSGKTTSNIILQHVNLRKGTADGEDALSIKGSGMTSNIMVDHVSGSWSEDEVISVTQRATNVTIQNSTLSEALTSNHAYGALIRPEINSNVSYNRNLFSNQKSRNPRPGSYDGATLNLEFQNNTIYNWSDRAGYIAGADTNLQTLNMNYTGNYLVAGPSTPNNATRQTAFWKENNTSPLAVSVWQAGNLLDSDTDTVRDGVDTGWSMFKQLTSGVTGAWAEGDKAPAAFAMPSTADAAAEAYAKTIAHVGATPWARNTTDRRLVNDVLNYTGFAPITAPPAAEWDAIMNAPTVTRPADWDTEVMPANTLNMNGGRGDGMPTWWELLRGFNPNAADQNVVTAEGYTRLEKYLHYLGAQANWNLNADGNWSAHMNWRGMRPETRDASANFIAGITAPRTVTLDAPVTVGQMSFSSPVAYTIAAGGGAANALTVDVISGRAVIDVSAGSHTIAAPLALAKPTDIHVAGGSALTVSNLLPTSAAVTKHGPGTLHVNGVRAAALNVQGGVVALAPSGGAAPASRVASLTVAPGATLDLADNKLIVAGGNLGTSDGTTYTGIQRQVQAAYQEGAWSGSGITTSMSDAATGLTTLAVATAAQTGHAGGTFAGVSVAPEDVLVMYTYGGDTNFDGKLDADDYGTIDFSVLTAGADGYYNGDFNYDGVVNADDYGVIDFNILAQGDPLGTSGAPASFAGVTAVPEPAACTFAIVAMGFAIGRRHRRRARAYATH